MYRLNKYLFRKGYDKAEKRYGRDPSNYFFDVAKKRVKHAKKQNGIDTLSINALSMLYTSLGAKMFFKAEAYFNGAESWISENGDTITSSIHKAKYTEDVQAYMGILSGRSKGFEFAIFTTKYGSRKLVTYDASRYSLKEAIEYGKESD